MNLELAMIFLCDVPSTVIRFPAPGPMHHVSYSLKVWLFRHQMTVVTSTEEKGIGKIAIFAVRTYVKAWKKALRAACAPCNYPLMKLLVEYKKINEKVLAGSSHVFISGALGSGFFR